MEGTSVGTVETSKDTVAEGSYSLLKTRYKQFLVV